jgi:hypothetical protein
MRLDYGGAMPRCKPGAARRAPMACRFVDLSIYLENDVVSDPPAFASKIQYFTHENSFAQIEP